MTSARTAHELAPRHPFARAGLFARTAPFCAASVLSFAMVPGTHPRHPLLALLGSALAVAGAGAVPLVPWRRLPRAAAAVVPLAFAVAVVLLIAAGNGSTTFVPLLALPILWSALHGSGREVAAVFLVGSAGLAAVWAVVGTLHPHEPVAEVGVFLTVGLLLAFAVHRVVRRLAMRERLLHGTATIGRSLAHDPDPRGRACREILDICAAESASLYELDGDGRMAITGHAGKPSAAGAHVVPIELDHGVLAVRWSVAAHADGAVLDTLQLIAAEVAGAIAAHDEVERLQDQARTDTLTAVANRRAWTEELPRRLASARRSGQPLSVAMADIDHFKDFNDSFGHQAGDRFLSAMAARWQGAIRPSDLLARYGGEEFSLVLPVCALQEAVELAERLRRAMPDGCTCSLGVAEWDGREGPDAVVARADAALYAAKAAGRDCVVPAAAPPADLRAAG